MRRPWGTCAALCFVALVLSASTLWSQMPEKDVRARLERVSRGEASQVRAEMPALLRAYPDDAGVRYIEAFLTQDGAQAAQRYTELVKKYPASVWADDALYKVYQYDFSNGLYKKADSVMALLRAGYPASPYLVAGGNGGGAATPKAKDESTAAPKGPAVTKQTPAAAENEKARSSAPTAPMPAMGRGYDVQAGVFSTEANARTASERLARVTGRTAAVRKKAGGAGSPSVVYVVVFEGFPSAESARRFSTELRTKHDVDSFVNPR